MTLAHTTNPSSRADRLVALPTSLAGPESALGLCISSAAHRLGRKGTPLPMMQERVGWEVSRQ